MRHWTETPLPALYQRYFPELWPNGRPCPGRIAEKRAAIAWLEGLKFATFRAQCPT